MINWRCNCRNCLKCRNKISNWSPATSWLLIIIQSKWILKWMLLSIISLHIRHKWTIWLWPNQEQQQHCLETNLNKTKIKRLASCHDHKQQTCPEQARIRITKFQKKLHHHSLSQRIKPRIQVKQIKTLTLMPRPWIIEKVEVENRDWKQVGHL